MSAPPSAPRLPDGYTLRQVERFEEPAFTLLVEALVLAQAAHLPVDDLLEAPPERKGLRQRRDALRLGIFQGEILCAFAYGWHDDDAGYYMAASAVRPEHRRRGLYAALLAETLRLARARGYATVWSRHVAGNNPILIAKLGAGFLITGMELSPSHGLLVRLSYPLDETAREALLVRAGWRRAPEGWARFLVERGGKGEGG